MSGRRTASALLLVTLGMAGCTGDGARDDNAEPVVVQPGAPGEPGQLVAPGAGGDLPYTEADVQFVHAMVAHHRQALELAGLVGERTASEDITLLAERIELSQADEIARMEGWLEARGEATAGHHHHGLMPGMLTPTQLTELAAATGPDFDRRFLDAMIFHHEGALVMVADLFEQGGAQAAEIYDLAADIDADQRIEIDRMRTLLASLTPQ
jgi:uncharacterized protein (DUF305 family)